MYVGETFSYELIMLQWISFIDGLASSISRDAGHDRADAAGFHCT